MTHPGWLDLSCPPPTQVLLGPRVHSNFLGEAKLRCKIPEKMKIGGIFSDLLYYLRNGNRGIFLKMHARDRGYFG
jgi:hypothetical protein